MSNSVQIEAATLSLPSSEFEQLRLWFLDLDYKRWDKQIEQDIEDGKLEALAQAAIGSPCPLGKGLGMRADTFVRQP